MDWLTDNWDRILDGFGTTFQLFAGAGVLAAVLGTLVASARVSPVPILRATAGAYVTLFRNTPLLVLILITYYGLPELNIRFSFYWLIVLAMGTYTASFVAEALRAGINAIPLGQAEAARSIGLGFGTTMTQVVLPQASRAVVAPMASVMIALVKNTSLAAAFGIAEAVFRMRGLLNAYADERIVIFVGIALGYIVLVELISFVAWLLERRWRVER